MAKLVSKTYGEALFQVACEGGDAKCAELLEEIRVLRGILSENPEFDSLMKHPGITKQEKLQVMETVFRGRVSEELVNFLDIIVSKERFGELNGIFDYFTDRVKERQQIGVVCITSAAALTEKQRAAVEQKILETTAFVKLEPHYSVDRELIGGLVIRIGDRVVDSSIRTKLDQMTKQLLQIQLG
ncbi:MAG: ATP synthase F1 subunit delta [Acetatifactor sp.]|nr:ATP synthase F1 subunit delta [Acetatifactor sp.]